MKKIIIVEGKNDYSKIKSIYKNIDILTTGGSSISNDFIKMVKTLSINHEIVLFLDPDGPGERIRNIIKNEIPSCSHIFAPKKDAISKNKRKIGVEHLSKKAIQKCFENIYEVNKQKKFDINELFELGLMGKSDSKQKRDYITNKLNLGECNFKRFKERLEMFNISIEKVKELLYERDNKKI